MRWRSAQSDLEPKTTIYEHIIAHLPPAGPGLTEGGDTLPDTQPKSDELAWISGGLDGAFGFHAGPAAGDEQLVLDVFGLLAKATRPGAKATDVGRLYEKVRTSEVLASLDAVLRMVRSNGLPAAGLRHVGVRLAKEGRHREPVKFGMALLGLLKGDPERDLLLMLGRHEEFTLFAVVAIKNSDPDSEPFLLKLAKSVEGWGRIQCVRRLSDAERSDTKDWILREGFRNGVMNEYLAFIAATTGGLVTALGGPGGDPILLDAACDIISALIAGGPAEDIDDYEQAPEAIRLLVSRLNGEAVSLHNFLAVDDIERFLADDEGWDGRLEKGWTADLRQELIDRTRAIKSWESWRALAVEGLASEDRYGYYVADRVARSLGVDTFENRWQRLQADPLRESWQWVFELCDERRIDEVIALAEIALPLEKIASGPAESLGIGPEWGPHRALDSVLQGLRRFPGRGWKLVETGLRSPVVRNRNMAIRTLSAWGPGSFSPEMRAAVTAAAEIEPRDDVRGRLEDLCNS
ncbi:MAG TPA: hypothetical protein VHV57_12305 [Acidimicrobiales bacterium]|jgi:hypothetical protein|nr:hypothetical protein [Acidimicrobiales bacterium]